MRWRKVNLHSAMFFFFSFFSSFLTDHSCVHFMYSLIVSTLDDLLEVNFFQLHCKGRVGITWLSIMRSIGSILKTAEAAFPILHLVFAISTGGH